MVKIAELEGLQHTWVIQQRLNPHNAAFRRISKRVCCTERFPQIGSRIVYFCQGPPNDEIGNMFQG
jgi:hypothetical protein